MTIVALHRYVVELAWLMKTSDYLATNEERWWRGAITAVLFASAWQTWNHINYFTTRFVIRTKVGVRSESRL